MNIIIAKKANWTFIALFIGLFFFATPLLAQKVKADFTGIHYFWVLEEQLSKDQLPDSLAWKQLFDAPFYSFYTKWGQERYMKRMLITAFMPSKQKSRDSLIQEGKWSKEVLNHLFKARTEKNNIISWVNELSKRDLFEEAKEKASAFLPETLSSKDIRPTIGFGLFHPQSNANDSAIVIDLLSENQASLLEVLGHEIHHFYTFSYRKKMNLTEQHEAYPLVNTIFQLQLEGIADLINMERFLAHPENSNTFLYDMYSKHYNNPSKNFEQVDILLKAIADTPSLMKRNALLIRDLMPLGAHPHGYYMAKTILKVNGKKTIINVLKNPFAFLRLYNKTAKKLKDRFYFGEKSMQLFTELEKKYTKD